MSDSDSNASSDIVLKSTAKRKYTRKNIPKKKPTLFNCSTCNRDFISKQGFESHLERHKPPGGYKCTKCNARFCMRKLLYEHNREAHGVFRCKICKSTFTDSDTFVKHVEEAHEGDQVISEVCEVCGRLFRTRFSLLIHVESKCGTIKRHKCTECDKAYINPYLLSAHLLTHKGDNVKQYCCSFCGKRFSSFGQLKAHEPKHTNEKPWKCEICSKAYPYRESLVTHMTTHTGIKPYGCENCGHTFSCVGNLQSHRRARRDSCGLPQFCQKVTRVAKRTSTKSNEKKPIKLAKIIKLATKKENLLATKKENLLQVNITKLDTKQKVDNDRKEVSITKELEKVEAVDDIKEPFPEPVKNDPDAVDPLKDAGDPFLIEYVFSPSIKDEVKMEVKEEENTEKEPSANLKVAKFDDKLKDEKFSEASESIDFKDFPILGFDDAISDTSDNDPPVHDDPINLDIPLHTPAAIKPAGKKRGRKRKRPPTPPRKNQPIESISTTKLEPEIHFSVKGFDAGISDTSDNDHPVHDDPINLDISLHTPAAIKPAGKKRGRKRPPTPPPKNQPIESISSTNLEPEMDFTFKGFEAGISDNDSPVHDDPINLDISLHSLAAINPAGKKRGRKLKRPPTPPPKNQPIESNSKMKLEPEIHFSFKGFDAGIADSNDNDPSVDDDPINLDISLHTPTAIKPVGKKRCRKRKRPPTPPPNNQPIESISKMELEPEIDFTLKCFDDVILNASGNDPPPPPGDESINPDVPLEIPALTAAVAKPPGKKRGRKRTRPPTPPRKKQPIKSSPPRKIDPELDLTLKVRLETDAPETELLELYQCMRCSLKFVSEKLLFDHLIETHQATDHEIEYNLGAADGEIKCPHCSRIFHLQLLYTKHLETHVETTIRSQTKTRDELVTLGSDGKTLYVCMKCGRKCASVYFLRQHEISDCGRKPQFQCNICHKSYHSKGSLKHHQTLHTGERPFLCSFCGKSFRTRGQHTNHLRIHTGEKPYKCQICPSAFAHRSSLITHGTTHTGEKPYMCQCGQTFSCVKNLVLHRNTQSSTCKHFPLDTKMKISMGVIKGQLYVGGKTQ